MPAVPCDACVVVVVVAPHQVSKCVVVSDGPKRLSHTIWWITPVRLKQCVSETTQHLWLLPWGAGDDPQDILVIGTVKAARSGANW